MYCICRNGGHAMLRYDLDANGQRWHYGETIAVLPGRASLESWTHFGQNQDSSVDNTIPLRRLFRNNIHLHVIHVFPKYSPTGNEDDEANELADDSILCLGRLHACIRTVVRCFSEKGSLYIQRWHSSRKPWAFMDIFCVFHIEGIGFKLCSVIVLQISKLQRAGSLLIGNGLQVTWQAVMRAWGFVCGESFRIWKKCLKDRKRRKREYWILLLV